MSVAELKMCAKGLGVKNFSRASKAELVALLQGKDISLLSPKARPCSPSVPKGILKKDNDTEIDYKQKSPPPKQIRELQDGSVQAYGPESGNEVLKRVTEPKRRETLTEDLSM